MAGEKSKKIGEDGEDLARNFIKTLGWITSEENVNIDCGDKPNHQCKTHGIDFIVAYDCPLVPHTRRNILISMKNSEKDETTTETARIKKDIRDLDRAMLCYQKSELRFQINQDSEAYDTVDSGLLIKINKDPDDSRSFIKNLPSSDRLDISEGHDIHFIENERFDLIDIALKHLSQTRSAGLLSYFYSKNSHNYAAEVAEISGNILPIQHLSASPLTYKYEDGNIREFIVISPSIFDSGTLERLVGLAHGCSQGWAGKITIMFPSITPNDKDLANKVLRGIRSQQVANSIDVEPLTFKSRLS